MKPTVSLPASGAGTAVAFDGSPVASAASFLLQLEAAAPATSTARSKLLRGRADVARAFCMAPSLTGAVFRQRTRMDSRHFGHPLVGTFPTSLPFGGKRPRVLFRGKRRFRADSGVPDREAWNRG